MIHFFDRLADGRLVVIDYKSGRSTAYVGLDHDDPLLHGHLLQLPDLRAGAV